MMSHLHLKVSLIRRKRARNRKGAAPNIQVTQTVMVAMTGKVATLEKEANPKRVEEVIAPRRKMKMKLDL
jgi:hypothetical protein